MKKLQMIRRRLFVPALSLLMLLSLMPADLVFAESQEIKADDNISQETIEMKDLKKAKTTSVAGKDSKTNENVYNVSNFDEFKAACEAINQNTSDEEHIINLTGDINFSKGSLDFGNDTRILGNGHTISFGKGSSFLLVEANAVLSLGYERPSGNENQLTITVSENFGSRATAFFVVGSRRSAGTLNMYDGVKLTGNSTNGASVASAVNISNGTFNMYGGEICGNTNQALAGMGSAVGSYGSSNLPCVFNMYGGKIYNNNVINDQSVPYEVLGGGVLMIQSTFNMYSGEIRENALLSLENEIIGYGGGVLLYDATANLEGGSIVGNSAEFGGGICSLNSIFTIKEDFILTDNQAVTGGGMYNQNGTGTINSGAVIANNIASSQGDDIAQDTGTLTLSPAEAMNAILTVDGSNEKITGWYEDAYNSRWTRDNAIEKDVTKEITDGNVFLKAAYEAYAVSYRFENEIRDQKLPDEVNTLLPVDKNTYASGKSVQAIQPTETAIKTADGVWTFKGYDADSKIVDDGDIEFVGIWTFALNEAPILHANDIELTVGDSFDAMAGVTASDKEDGDLTAAIIVTENTVDTAKVGTYAVTYSVTDSHGVTTTKTVTVTVKEAIVPSNHPPIIHVSDKTLTVGDIFDPLEDVTASDEEDGDLTSELKVTANNVDTGKAGTYLVTYSVTDSDGNVVSKTVVITVKAETTVVEPTDPVQPSDDGKAPTNNDTDKTPETAARTLTCLWMVAFLVSGMIIVVANKKRKNNALLKK